MKFEDTTKFRLLQVGAFKQWFANQTGHGRQEDRFARRLLAEPHGAAAICRHRVRAAGVRCPHRLLQSVAGVCRRAEARRLLEVPGAPEGQRSARRRDDVSVDRRLVGADLAAAQRQDGNGAGAARPVRRRQDQDRAGDGLADRRPLSAGRLAALHHRPVQLAHGLAAGAARRRGVLGRRQGERRHAAGSGVGRSSHARIQGRRSDPRSKTTSGCS